MSEPENHPCAHCGAALYSFAEAQAHHSGNCPSTASLAGQQHPECPAWEDGYHLWESHCESPGWGMGPRGLASEALMNATWTKRCACGAEVRHVKR